MLNLKPLVRESRGLFYSVEAGPYCLPFFRVRMAMDVKLNTKILIARDTGKSHLTSTVSAELQLVTTNNY